MIARHTIRRQPKATLGFSWTRFPTVDGNRVAGRLYRRDHSRRIHQQALTFIATSDCQLVAARLRKVRHSLREEVDDIKLATTGVSQ